MEISHINPSSGWWNTKCLFKILTLQKDQNLFDTCIFHLIIYCLCSYLFVWPLNLMMRLLNLCSNFVKCRVNKENRAAGILDNHVEGEKYSQHFLRKYVRNKSPEIMPNINGFFSDPKYWSITDEIQLFWSYQDTTNDRIAFFWLWLSTQIKEPIYTFHNNSWMIWVKSFPFYIIEHSYGSFQCMLHSICNLIKIFISTISCIQWPNKGFHWIWNFYIG